MTTVTSEAPALTTAPAKPTWRGWLHTVMAPVSLVGSLTLLIFADGWIPRLGIVIYALTALIMFGNSAVYHRGPWSPATKQVFRRLDHAFIFVFIAGTYTPLCLSLLTGWSQATLLILIWSCALAGLLFRVLWLSAPRALYVALYIVMGWAAVGWLPQLWAAGGPAVVILLLAGGLVYTLGAVVYGRKRPDPWPMTFGFHEIFHLCTVVAALCHFAAIAVALLA